MENNGRSWPKFRIAFIPWSDGLVTLVRPKLLNAIHALQTSFRINQVINPSKIRFSTWLIRAVWAFGAIIRSPFWKKTFHRTVAINKKKTCVIRWHDQSTIDFSSWASPLELRSWRTKKIYYYSNHKTLVFSDFDWVNRESHTDCMETISKPSRLFVVKIPFETRAAKAELVIQSLQFKGESNIKYDPIW